MLLVLRSQIEEVETVAAACHILYSITHDDAIKGPPAVDVENQLSQAKAEQASPNTFEARSQKLQVPQQFHTSGGLLISLSLRKYVQSTSHWC